MADIINNSNPTNHRSESDGIFITAEHLKSRLDHGQHLMVLDIGRDRDSNGGIYRVQHMQSVMKLAKKNIMPNFPKNIEIVLVGDDEEYMTNGRDDGSNSSKHKVLARRHKRVEMGFGGILLWRTYFLNRYSENG